MLFMLLGNPCINSLYAGAHDVKIYSYERLCQRSHSALKLNFNINELKTLVLRHLQHVLVMK